MKFLANENFPLAVVNMLRDRGEDVVWVGDDMRAATDTQVLARAQQDARIVLTFDKDFGELAFRSELSATCGVVLFRLTGASPDEDNARAIAVFSSGEIVAGRFVVVESDRIRVRPLPSAPSSAG
ncbi:MAG: DUF5615 family PIN-like protein [Planctomycetes bacterium]|nr:DUF5615 family PIN-like protein [Planctomycetota bacterium]